MQKRRREWTSTCYLIGMVVATNSSNGNRGHVNKYSVVLRFKEGWGGWREERARARRKQGGRGGIITIKVGI
jgi:hypothetical protein